MYRGKKILAIIPARSGSKGLPNKNILLLNGVPLLAHAINHAIDSGLVDFVFLSTDSEEYAEIGKAYGAQVPFLRPPDISQDLSYAREFVLHALEELEKIGEIFDYFILLQPTSPLRTAQDVQKALCMAIDQGLEAVVGVCKAEHPIAYYNTLDETYSLDGFIKNMANRQQLQAYYRINGGLYISTCANYRNTQSYYVPNSKAYIMPINRSIDIDTMDDFKLAQFIINENYT